MTTQILLALTIPSDSILADFFALHLLAWMPLVGLIALALGAVSVGISAASGAIARLLDGDDDYDDDLLEQKRMDCVIGFRRGR